MHHERHEVPHSIIASVYDETPYEHEERYAHDSDAHFWATEHGSSLYDRLHDHYHHEAHEEDHHMHGGHWSA